MSNYKNSRRKFIKNLGLGVAGAGATMGYAANNNFDLGGTYVPPRAADAKYMGGFAAKPIDKVRCAFIGVGSRGKGHVEQISELKGVEVVAICDLYQDYAEKSEKFCKNQGKKHKKLKLYVGEQDLWKKMLEEIKPDAVFISTPWELHAPMAIGAMEAGAHAFVEVPLATTTEDLWKIVEVSEKTQKHCMMMENVNYGREELLYLNMCRQGVIGELLHGEAAYIHELKWQMAEEKRGTGSWRTPHYASPTNGNLYPTHGLGPVAQYMNLARTDDNFARLVSFSSPGLGRNIYAKKNYPKDHKWNQIDYKGGDMSTSIIKTNLGRTIMVQWDETSPRPYDRKNLIQGTSGILAGFPTRVAFEGGVPGVTEDHHHWAQGDQLASIYEKYEHPLYKRLGALAVEKGDGHGGMDFIMRYRIIECLRKGLPLDQNLYEGCFWSAVTPMTKASVTEGGMPQEFPDFTRGAWKTTKPLDIIV